MPSQFKHLSFCGGIIFNWDGEKQVGTPIPMCGRDDCEVCKGSSVPKEKRYDWVPDGTGYGYFKDDEPPAGRIYTAEDFDRVVAKIDALQALLTAADERADHSARVAAIAVEDVVLLQKRVDKWGGLLRQFQEVAHGGFLDDDHVRRVRRDIDAALKTAQEAANCKACDGKRSVCVDWDSGAWAECAECAKP